MLRKTEEEIDSMEVIRWVLQLNCKSETHVIFHVAIRASLTLKGTGWQREMLNFKLTKVSLDGSPAGVAQREVCPIAEDAKLMKHELEFYN